MDGYLMTEDLILARRCDSIFGQFQKTNLENFGEVREVSFLGGRSLQAQSFFRHTTTLRETHAQI